MQLTLGELAKLVGGTVEGQAETNISGANTLVDATGGEITLIDQAERLKQLSKSPAAAAVVPQDVEIPAELAETISVIRTVDVHEAFAKIVRRFRPRRLTKRIGVSPTAHVSPSARLAYGVDVHAGATVGDDVEIGVGTVIFPGAHIMAGCKLGENVVVHPNVVMYENTQVGSNCIIHAGAVLGADGFGYRQQDGRHVLSAQLGCVILADHVEVGACTTIDRGTYGPTFVGEGTKIDNQVMIAHNCRIGRHNLICAQVGIAGSTSTGDYVVIAGQAGIKDHVHIGSGSMLSAMAGITKDVPNGSRQMGVPAFPEKEYRTQHFAIIKLPEMRRQFKALLRQVEELQQRLDGTGDSRGKQAA